MNILKRVVLSFMVLFSPGTEGFFQNFQKDKYTVCRVCQNDSTEYCDLYVSHFLCEYPYVLDDVLSNSHSCQTDIMQSLQTDVAFRSVINNFITQQCNSNIVSTSLYDNYITFDMIILTNKPYSHLFLRMVASNLQKNSFNAIYHPLVRVSIVPYSLFPWKWQIKFTFRLHCVDMDLKKLEDEITITQESKYLEELIHDALLTNVVNTFYTIPVKHVIH